MAVCGRSGCVWVPQLNVSFAMKKILAAALVSVAIIATTNGSAQARQELRVQVDESQMMVIPGTPGAIIIGNPSIADVSIQGSQIFIHGRGFGQTNLTILDLQGNAIVDFDIMVTHVQSSSLMIFKGPSRESYSCAPYCENTVQIGDSASFFSGTASQIEQKTKLATGSSTIEASAPVTPAQ
jgi:hypothetical protein